MDERDVPENDWLDGDHYDVVSLWYKMGDEREHRVSRRVTLEHATRVLDAAASLASRIPGRVVERDGYGVRATVIVHLPRGPVLYCIEPFTEVVF